MNALNYYVYYKADPARLEELRALVAALFDEVEAATGIRGRWERRRDDPGTFMEIYANVPGDGRFDGALAGALDKVGFGRIIPSRITEIFQCA